MKQPSQGRQLRAVGNEDKLEQHIMIHIHENAIIKCFTNLKA